MKILLAVVVGGLGLYFDYISLDFLEKKFSLGCLDF
jgi:hypothetical protein